MSRAMVVHRNPHTGSLLAAISRQLRYGDVITAIGGSGRLFLVIAPAADDLTTVMPIGAPDLMHDARLRADKWEIVE